MTKEENVFCTVCNLRRYPPVIEYHQDRTKNNPSVSFADSSLYIREPSVVQTVSLCTASWTERKRLRLHGEPVGVR